MSRENYTNKTFRRNLSCDFDARPRVRVYYTTLTTEFLVKRDVNFVCLRYAKTRETGFYDETKPEQILSLQ